MVLLVLATGALIVFILLMGDFRRKSAALQRTRAHAAELEQRVGTGGVLPLELSARESADAASPSFRVESLGRDQAYRLRHVDGPVLVAWTGVIRGDILPEGRAAVFFERGAFTSRWMDERGFVTFRERQTARVSSSAPGE